MYPQFSSCRFQHRWWQRPVVAPTSFITLLCHWVVFLYQRPCLFPIQIRPVTICKINLLNFLSLFYQLNQVLVNQVEASFWVLQDLHTYKVPHSGISGSRRDVEKIQYWGFSYNSVKLWHFDLLKRYAPPITVAWQPSDLSCRAENSYRKICRIKSLFPYDTRVMTTIANYNAFLMAINLP